MAYGDLLTTSASTYADRGVASGSLGQAITTSGSNSVLVAVAVGHTFDNLTCTSTLGLVPIEFQVPQVGNNYASSSQNFLKVFYCLNVPAGTYTWTFAWDAGGGSQNWYQFAVYELDAASTTYLDTAAIGYNRYTEDAITAGEGYTTSEIGFSLYVAAQQGLYAPTGYQYTGALYDAYWATLWPATPYSSTMLEISPFVHTYMALVGGLKGKSTLGGPASVGCIGWIGKKVWSDYAYLHDHVSMTYSYGAGVDATSIILPFGKTSNAMATPVETTVTAVNVDTATSAGATNQTLSVSPAPVAGNLLISNVRWVTNPGAIINDDMITDGWTLAINDTAKFHRVYYKVATAANDTQLNLQWTNSVAYGWDYSEWSDIIGSTPTFVDGSFHKVFPGSSCGPGENGSSTHAPVNKGKGSFLWFNFNSRVVNGNYVPSSTPAPGGSTSYTSTQARCVRSNSTRLRFASYQSTWAANDSVAMLAWKYNPYFDGFWQEF